MPSLITEMLLGQYEASLTMLRDTVVSCPAEHWERKIANDPARFVAFHTLYCTDLYLSRRKDDFQTHEFVIEGRGRPFGEPFPPGELPPGLSQPRTVEYADYCIAKARTSLAAESEADLAGDTGFGRPFSRAEMHLYNIRHIQHHTGALAAHIRRLAPEVPSNQLAWIGSGTTDRYDD